jgi:hypothetical protein
LINLGQRDEPWEPDAKDLRVFGRTLNPSVKKYKEVYKPIRDKVIAHKELKDAASINVLFGKTLIIEIEVILKALHVLASGRRATLPQRHQAGIWSSRL